jgi:hypothetical protein
MSSMVQDAYDMGITTSLGGMPSDRFYRNDNNYSNKQTNKGATDISEYVQLMKSQGIRTVVNMNKYLTKNDLWSKFSTIQRKNTYSSGFVAMGVSKEAYSKIMDLYKTDDIIQARLIVSKKIASK